MDIHQVQIIHSFSDRPMHNIIFVDYQLIINQVIKICHNNQISREYSEELLCNFTTIMDYGNFANFVLLEEIMLFV